ncbi:MAG: hypothetical protein RBU45_15345 [Myxococcota bacterium]|jgi:hypothetical protein|nr:hypothetical protein [Myxococcota bacterium]
MSDIAQVQQPPQAESTQAQFDKAKGKHKKNLQTLDAMVKSGTKETGTKYGTAWPNACEWIQAGKTNLHALTQTHDAAARATALGQNGNNAMFGYGVASPTESDYNKDDVTDKRNIYEYAKPNWLGFRQASTPSLVAIIEPADKSKDDVQGIIVHEIQHDADHHADDPWSGYETEFRAYWLQQSFQDQSPESGTGTDGFDSARQQAILTHLYNDPSYAYVKDAWDNDTDGFQGKVIALKFPKGLNIVNSPRIDDVYLEMTKATPDKAKVIEKAGKLTKADKKAIRDKGMKSDWEKLINEKFTGDDIKAVKKAFGF